MPSRVHLASAVTLALALFAGLIALPTTAQADERSVDGNALCATNVVDIPAGVRFARMLVVGQKGQAGVDRTGQDGAVGGSAGASGIVEAVVEVLPGQRLWLAGGSTLLPGGTRGWGATSGGNGSFVSTIDPAPYCPGGGSAASTFPRNAFLAVAGGGGGGGDGGNHTVRSTGGSGGAPGSAGGDGGANDARDGAGGGPGTPTGGGGSGAGGYTFPFTEGSAGGQGAYLAGGGAGVAAIGSGSATAGGGGGGLFGGGGGGGGTDGGSGGGGGGANYLPPYISPNPPTDTQRSGTLRNGSTDADGPNVEVFPLYPTASTVTVAPSPAYPSDELVATVRVAGVDGGPAPVGTVELLVGDDAVQTATLSDGRVDIPLGTRPAGDLRLQARYPGAQGERVGFLSSSASAVQPVEAVAVVATSTTVDAAPAVPYAGDEVRLSAAVTRLDGRPVDTGEVTFTSATVDGAEAPATIARVAVLDGRATTTATFPQAGATRVTAAYSGTLSRTEDVRPSSADVSVVVRSAGTPVFTTQPEASAITYGDDPPAFTVSLADGPRTTLHWQRSTGEDAPFEDIPGAVGSTYDPSPRTDTGTRFRAVAVSAFGTGYSESAVLTVRPAPLTVTARDERMDYGTDAPAFRADYGTGDEGFRLGDGPAALDGELRCASTPPADRETPPGTYPIECSGQTSPRYDIRYRPATLSVDGVTQEIRFVSDPPSPGRVGESYDVDADGGPSGEPVLFSTDPDSPWCTVSEDGRVDFTATIDLPFAGECVIHADQEGRAFFPPAEQETQTVRVEKVAPAVAVQWGPSTSVAAGSYRTLDVVASGTPDVRYQWFSSRDNRTFDPIPLAQGPSYRLTTRMSNDGVFFRVLVYNASGPTPSEGRIVSPSTRVHVEPAGIEVTSPDVEMVAGSDAPVVTPEYTPLIGSDTLESLGLEPTCTVDVTPETPPGVFPGAVQCRGFEHPDYRPYYYDGTLTVTADTDPPVGIGPGGGTGGADLGGTVGPAGVTDPRLSAELADGAPRRGGLATTGQAGTPLLALLGASVLASGLLLRVAARRRPARTR